MIGPHPPSSVVTCWNSFGVLAYGLKLREESGGGGSQKVFQASGNGKAELMVWLRPARLELAAAAVPPRAVSVITRPRTA